MFGSYARGDATEESDIDIIVVGVNIFPPKIFLPLEKNCTKKQKKDVDAFEIREINKNTAFYDNVMKEGVRIA